MSPASKKRVIVAGLFGLSCVLVISLYFVLQPRKKKATKSRPWPFTKEEDAKKEPTEGTSQEDWTKDFPASATRVQSIEWGSSGDPMEDLATGLQTATGMKEEIQRLAEERGGDTTSEAYRNANKLLFMSSKDWGKSSAVRCEDLVPLLEVGLEHLKLWDRIAPKLDSGAHISNGPGTGVSGLVSSYYLKDGVLRIQLDDELKVVSWKVELREPKGQ